jgi:hypothetical protein
MIESLRDSKKVRFAIIEGLATFCQADFNPNGIVII